MQFKYEPMQAQNDNSFSIFLVDDDEDEHLLFQEAIEEVRYVTRLTALSTCEKLIDHLIIKAAQPPDLIFLDINMPRKNGIECLQEIRRQKSLKEMPIVMYSNSLRPEDIVASYDNGANIFITKPFSLQDEVSLIKKILSFYKRQLFGTSTSIDNITFS